MIYTTYFAKLKQLPSDIIPISICGKAPEWYKGLQYKKLAPKYWFFAKYKEDHDEQFYTEQFNNEVLHPLNPAQVIFDLYHLSDNKDFALVCYEKPNDFCHRHIVADWLKRLGFNVKEFE